MVYIISKSGVPLMPTKRHGHIRKLLNAGRAKVVRRTPFTVQLTYESTSFTQAVTLGVDAGSKTIGLSASTETKELFAAEVKPRNDVVDLLSVRRTLRRSRRNRTTRYRAPHFDNRVKSKRKGWLAPSVEVKIEEHIRSILKVCDILPITTVVVETAEFDTQRLKAMESGHPLPVGTDYQKGEMYDAYNVRQCVLHRDHYTCQGCGAHKGKLHVHHIESRKTGGETPGNKVTLCKACHTALHAGKLKLSLKRRGSMRDAAFMGIMRKTLLMRLASRLPVAVELRETMGYITKYLRDTNGLAKSHITDARCIAGHPLAAVTAEYFLIKPVRRHNRQIQKCSIPKGGIRKKNQAAYLVQGFRLFDKVSHKGVECFITGRRTSGYFVLKRLDGTKVHYSASAKQLYLLEKATSYLIERAVCGISSHG